MQEKKHVLVLQHTLASPAGRVTSMLDEYEVPYHLIHIGRDQLPDATRYQAIIALGGSQHVYDSRRYPYTVHEEAYMRQAIDQGISCLGICLGGQLLARAFGATVEKLPKVYIGFLEVHATVGGKADPIYKTLPDYQQAFQWHEDGFQLPTGAVELAHRSDGFNLAFRYGTHTYGLQYHVELTEDILDHWLHDPALKKEFIDAYGSEAYHKTERETIELFPTYALHSTLLLKNFFSISGLI
ncbi:MAG: type 1 glutamine amidotransferase [Ktedonobacteraceae bacterium]